MPHRPRLERTRGWSKIASAIWHPPDDPQIFGDLEIDATALLEFMHDARQHAGVHLTPTHVVGRAVAHAMGRFPGSNAHIAFDRLIRHDTIEIFFVVQPEESRELSGVKVEHADEKTAVEIARELGRRVRDIRGGEDELDAAKSLLDLVPTPVFRAALKVISFFASDLGADLAALGVPAHTFGSALVTSVGMFGIRHAYAPLSSFYRVPACVLVNEITKKAVVVDDEIVIRPIMTLSATLDHRVIDGLQAANLMSAVEEYCQSPWDFDPDVPRGVDRHPSS